VASQPSSAYQATGPRGEGFRFGDGSAASAPRRWLRRLRTVAHVALAATPSFVKVPIYRRLLGFKIAADARIGVSVLDVDRLELGSGARIGHGNFLTRTQHVSLGRGATIDHLNLIRGGKEVVLEDYAWVMRFNVLNSIPDHDCETPTDSRLHIKAGACIVSGHRLDFTDYIELGINVILGGRNSSLWTHNRQESRPIRIADFCYLGSEVRLGPGAALASCSILGMGAVLVKAIDRDRVVVGGVPAKIIRDVTPDDERRLKRKTRRSVPDDAY
jgi:acetyltransferase-like isoleucine patch superfamily enzyme